MIICKHSYYAYLRRGQSKLENGKSVVFTISLKGTLSTIIFHPPFLLKQQIWDTVHWKQKEPMN